MSMPECVLSGSGMRVGWMRAGGSLIGATVGLWIPIKR